MQKFPCVMQDGIKDCGVASLLTIIKNYGGDVPREYLRDLTNTTKDGVDALSLLEAGRKLGFDAKGVYGNFLDIEDRFLPCIAHVIIDSKYKHFVVIYKIDRKKQLLFISDPAKGLIKITFDKFNLICTGNFLFFTPNKKIPVIKNNNEVKKVLSNILYENKRLLIMILLCAAFYTISQIIGSYSFKFIIERAITYNSYNNLYIFLVILLSLYIFKDVSDYIKNRLVNFISCKIDYILINNTLAHILSLPHLYYKNRTVGEIISRINDLGEIRDAVSHLIVTFLVDFILFIFTMLFMFSLNKTITLIIILLIIVYVLINLLFNKILYKKIKHIKESESLTNSYMIEIIDGSNSIKGMNMLDRILEKFSSKYNDYIDSSYRFSLISNVQKLLNDIVVSLIFLTIMFLGSIFVIEEKMSLGSLIAYNSVVYYFLDPIKNIINFDIIFKRIKIVVQRINELLAIKEECYALDSSKLDLVDGNIKVEDLSFSYNSHDYLFKNLSLEIKKGEKVVILGNSGCGKSTLAKILAKYVNVDRNCVFVNGRDINDYNLFCLRENITYVSQNEIIFTDSIYNNINIKNKNRSEEVYQICEDTLVDNILKRRNADYNMLLEENGNNLSGGERQRIILARSFLKESNIYILDESFSEIDVETERKIIKNIFKKYADKTIIVISHRFDNNDLYDRIINMEEVIYGN